MPYLCRDNISFYFEERGSGLPFVFSHGLGGSLAHVNDLLGDLAGTRLILYDNRGHGKTTGIGDPGRLTFPVMADDMAALLDSLTIPQSVVGGVSMGAGIALAFALKYPSRTRALVLSRPAWLNRPSPPNLMLLPQVADLVERLGPERAREFFGKSPEVLALRRNSPETAKSLEGLFLDRSADALVLTLRSIPGSVPFQSFDELKIIRAPTLILVNREDPIHPMKYGERLDTAIPTAQLREFPSKSQGLNAHQRCFHRLVSEFLDRLNPRSL